MFCACVLYSCPCVCVCLTLMQICVRVYYIHINVYIYMPVQQQKRQESKALEQQLAEEHRLQEQLAARAVDNKKHLMDSITQVLFLLGCSCPTVPVGVRD